MDYRRVCRCAMLAACALAILLILVSMAGAATAASGSSPAAGDARAGHAVPSVKPAPTPTPVPLVLVSGFVFDEHLTVVDQDVPIAGAWLSFIVNNTTYTTVTNLLGAYSIAIPAYEKCTVVVSAPGFATRIIPEVFQTTRTRDFLLFPIPANWIQPYALYPVLETSPGRDTDCTIAVSNCQVIDQTVTMTVAAPDGWIVWFPVGNAVNIQSGCSAPLVFRLRYCGVACGPQTITVTVSTATYSEQVSVVVIVKELPFETIDLFANSYFKEVQPGAVVRIQLHAINWYAQGKFLAANINAPQGWGAKTEDFVSSMSVRTDEQYFIYKNGGTYDFLLRIYVPFSTRDDTYQVTIFLCGEGLCSNILTLFVKVNSTMMLDGYLIGNSTEENGVQTYHYDIKENGPLIIHAELVSNWTFPVYVQPFFSVLDEREFNNWSFTFLSYGSTAAKQVYLTPGKTREIIVKITPPAGKIGVYDATLGFSSKDAESSYNIGSVITDITINITGMAQNKTRDRAGYGGLESLICLWTILSGIGFTVLMLLRSLSSRFK